MDLKTLAARAGLTKITVREAAQILRPRGGEFEIRARLQKDIKINNIPWGKAEKTANGTFRYFIVKELLPTSESGEVV